MVIEIVDIHGMSVLEPKRHPPVGRDGNPMVTLHAPLEKMQTKAGKVHALGAAAPVQCCQDAQEFRHVAL